MNKGMNEQIPFYKNQRLLFVLILFAYSSWS